MRWQSTIMQQNPLSRIIDNQLNYTEEFAGGYIEDMMDEEKSQAMVRNHKRTTTQQSWDPRNMLRAIEAVENRKMGYKSASRNYNVPRSTLKRKVLGKNRDAVSNKKILGSKRTVFTPEQEQELVNYILELEIRFFGLKTTDVRYIAYSLAEKNNIKHPFNIETRLAGEDWLSSFRKRHPEIALRSPEATSLARAQGFNRQSVAKFFKLLKDITDKQNYTSHRIFNVDETGLSTTQSRSSKVFAKKGRKQVGSLTSQERGTLCTAVICMGAGDGDFAASSTTDQQENEGEKTEERTLNPHKSLKKKTDLEI
ncbi:hypothetical protein JTB14_030033 [Gonioctena quinquepunctata]|nr:hypothetical protein JTB14_030033 [Gonioctena quinquepunctata]